MIRFTVDEEPVGKGRGRTPPGGGRPYTPQKTVRYEKRVKAACKDHMRRHGLSPFAEPVVLAMTIRLTPPKAASKKKRALMLGGEIVPTKKPDCSNVLKAVEDALNKVAYDDDALISRISVDRVYAEHSGVDVVIESYDEARARERQKQRPGGWEPLAAGGCEAVGDAEVR